MVSQIILEFLKSKPQVRKFKRDQPAFSWDLADTQTITKDNLHKGMLKVVMATKEDKISFPLLPQFKV